MRTLYEYHTRRRIWTSQFFKHTDATHLQTDIKTIQMNVAKVRVDFLKSPSSNLMCHKTSETDHC